MPDVKRGFYQKYLVYKTEDGELVTDSRTFTLLIDKDPHAMYAIRAYAESVEREHGMTQLVADLYQLATGVEEKWNQERAAKIRNLSR